MNESNTSRIISTILSRCGLTVAWLNSCLTTSWMMCAAHGMCSKKSYDVCNSSNNAFDVFSLSIHTPANLTPSALNEFNTGTISFCNHTVNKITYMHANGCRQTNRRTNKQSHGQRTCCVVLICVRNTLPVIRVTAR